MEFIKLIARCTVVHIGKMKLVNDFEKNLDCQMFDALMKSDEVFFTAVYENNQEKLAAQARCKIEEQVKLYLGKESDNHESDHPSKRHKLSAKAKYLCAYNITEM